MAEKVALINLGCPKNLVDAEVMLGHLRERGYELTPHADRADVVVVNTCGFLQEAAQESVDALLAAARQKREGGPRAVIAAGCMTQRYGADVADAMPEVDGFLGVGQAQALPDVVARVLRGERASVLTGPSAGFEGYGLRLQATPSHSAYLKISEGCDRHCAFCVIPQIRGRMVSRPTDSVLREAELLGAQGVREAILIGQDPTRWGVDLPADSIPSPRLPELLERLSNIASLRWIRLMYLFPDRHAPAVLRALATLPRLCRYVDMPLQHAAPSVLRRMNRPGGADEFLRLLAEVRGLSSDIAVRSTFIVGFPGETAAEFAELEAFVEAAELDWLGLFRYSPEEGSSAAALPDPVPVRTARARYDRLMRRQQEISRRRLRRWVGRELEVVVEQVTGSTGVGRTQGQAPDIDGETRLDLTDLPGLRPGDFVRAEITGSDVYDLTARPVELLERPPRANPDLLRIGVLPQAGPASPEAAAAASGPCRPTTRSKSNNA
jgi:ribosomal protein S12 methylthiotransferase